MGAVELGGAVYTNGGPHQALRRPAEFLDNCAVASLKSLNIRTMQPQKNIGICAKAGDVVPAAHGQPVGRIQTIKNPRHGPFTRRWLRPLLVEHRVHGIVDGLVDFLCYCRMINHGHSSHVRWLVG